MKLNKLYGDKILLRPLNQALESETIILPEDAKRKASSMLK